MSDYFRILQTSITLLFKSSLLKKLNVIIIKNNCSEVYEELVEVSKASSSNVISLLIIYL